MSVLGIQSEYSLLESLLKVDDLVLNCKNQGYKFLSITDTNNIFASYKLAEKCKKENMQFILGTKMDIDFSNNPDFSFASSFFFYPKNDEGYKELLYLLKKINYHKEKITLEDVRNHCADIIVVSNGDSVLYKNIPNIDIDTIKKGTTTSPQIERLLKILNYFKTNILNFKVGVALDTYEQTLFKSEILYYLSLKNKIPALPVHQNKYFSTEDKECYNTFIKIANSKNKITEYEDYSFWTCEKIKNKFKNYKGLLDNLAKFAKEIKFELKQPQTTSIALFSKENSKKELLRLTGEALKERNLKGNEIYEKRLEYELDVISKMGFASYFLVVYNIIKYAKSNNILVGPGRGSAGASLVSYLLNITEVDPVKHNLYFERFLNISRKGMPDIDIDFPDDKREEVINYCIEKFGLEHTAFITTFDSFGPKSALRDVKKVSKDNQENFVKETVRKIIGIPRHIGTHPAGVILVKENISEILPVISSPLGYYQVSFEMADIEKMGILKTDFLSLRNLKIISDTVKYIKQKDPQFNIKTIPYDDDRTYKVLSKGKTKGIFQLESEGIKNLLKKMKPREFKDIINLLGLYRPGPLKNIDVFLRRMHGEKFAYLDPSLEDVLKETYGLIVFQEQIMKIATTFSNYSLAEADVLRRAISKKKEEELRKEKSKFIKGAIANNKKESVAEEVYNYILKFADYGFNKAHSVAYSMITYQMAYLKSNYFLEFVTALLNNCKNDASETLFYIEALKSQGIQIIPPYVSKATTNYQIINDKIMLPFDLIKGVAKEKAEGIIKERERMPFTDVQDFSKRMKKLNLTNTDPFIFASSFDEFSKCKKKLYNEKNVNESVLDIITLKKTMKEEFKLEELMEFETMSYGFNIFYPISRVLKNIAKERKQLLVSSIKEGTHNYIGVIKSIYNKSSNPQNPRFALQITDGIKTIDVDYFKKEVENLQIGKNHIIYKFKIRQETQRGRTYNILENATISPT